MKRGRHPGATICGLSCCGKAKSGYGGRPCARAAAPPLSSSQYRSPNAMLFEIQTIAPASSSSLAESVSGPPVMIESMRKPVCRHRAQAQHRHERDPDRTQLPRPAVDRARIADDQHYEQDGFDHRECPVRPEPKVVGQEQRKHDRRDDGPDHWPTRLADDGVIPIAKRFRPCRRRPVVLHCENLSRWFRGRPTDRLARCSDVGASEAGLAQRPPAKDSVVVTCTPLALISANSHS